MENRYLSPQKINQISGILNTYLSTGNKIMIQYIKDKHGVILVNDKKTNMNMFWLQIVNQLKNDNSIIDPISKQTFAYNLKEGGGLAVREMVLDHMKKTGIDTVYNFICKFEINEMYFKIGEITRFEQLPFNPDFNTLLTVSDYKQYLTKNYGINACNQKAVKNSKRVQEFIENLLQDIPNKAGFIEALSEYCKTQDFDTLHNNLHLNT